MTLHGFMLQIIHTMVFRDQLLIKLTLRIQLFNSKDCDINITYLYYTTDNRTKRTKSYPDLINQS